MDSTKCIRDTKSVFKRRVGEHRVPEVISRWRPNTAFLTPPIVQSAQKSCFFFIYFYSFFYCETTATLVCASIIGFRVLYVYSRARVIRITIAVHDKSTLCVSHTPRWPLDAGTSMGHRVTCRTSSRRIQTLSPQYRFAAFTASEIHPRAGSARILLSSLSTDRCCRIVFAAVVQRGTEKVTYANPPHPQYRSQRSVRSPN